MIHRTRTCTLMSQSRLPGMSVRGADPGSLPLTGQISSVHAEAVRRRPEGQRALPGIAKTVPGRGADRLAFDRQLELAFVEMHDLLVMSWLATELAKAGFVVAGPNHPGTTSGDSTPANTPKLWERTQDLSAVIDMLTTDPQWSGVVDADSIGVVGFSLGGAAAMEIAGARANLDAYARYCDTYTKWDCAWYAGGKAYVNDEAVLVDKVNLRAIDKMRFEQSNLDRRIKSAVLIDPGLAQAYDEQSLKEIAIPMSFTIAAMEARR